MPVEIREMVVRAVVGEPQDNSQASGEIGSRETKHSADRAALVEECVRQVLKALKKSRER